MILSHIVAASENNVIGTKGSLPWYIPEDFKFFKDKTKDHIIIMGRKTFESLPGSRPLPDRLNIVITRNEKYKAEGALVVPTLKDALELAKKHLPQYKDEVYIIGGGEIYEQSLSLVDRIYITRVHKYIEGDTKYPIIDEAQFLQVGRVDRQEPIPFSFLTFKRKV